MHQRMVSLAAKGLSVSLFLLVCGVASAAEKVKVGYIATMSGPGASLGTDILDGFKMGLKHCGDKLGGAPVELIVGDD